MLRNRGFIAILCIAVLLAAAMAPFASDSPCAVLVPLAPLFGMVVSVPVERTEPGHPASLSALAPLPSRAPPAA